MSTTPNPRPSPTVAVLADRLEVALTTWIAAEKPKQSNRLERLFEAVLSTPADDPEAREINKAYFRGLFPAARKVRRKMRRALDTPRP